MKAKHIRTIKSLINEYGMQSGVSTPVGNQSSGAVAKQSAINKASKSPTTNKPSQSPTTTQATSAPAPQEPQEPKVSKASELEKDFEFADEQGDQVKVISPVGQGKNKDALIVQNQRSKEFYTMQPDDEIELPQEEVSEGKLGKMLTKGQRKIHIGRKIKRLTREMKRRVQGDEPLFEINFNSKQLARDALNSNVKCGFEAETAWEGIAPSDDGDSDWLYEYNWYDIEDFLLDQEGRSAVDDINTGYDEFIDEQAMDREYDIVDEMVREREEDESYLEDYVNEELAEWEIEEYRDNYLEDMDDDQKEEYEDWDIINWGRQYTEEERLDDYKEWLADGIRDNGEAMERAYEEAKDDYDIDSWANSEYGSWSSCLSEYGYYLTNPDAGGGLEAVADVVSYWARNNSQFDNIEYGEYHSTGGGIDYWRVETDSSIDADYGTGAEIISPVYSTPKQMLKEMKSLFDIFDDEGADTNGSTGLHVTMSYAGKSNRDEPNRLKLALLLGDKYLLSTFGREGNSYAKSQVEQLQKMSAELKRDPSNTQNVQNIEKILEKGISRDKFSSINFKGDTDRETGNELIEFRIGGGSDYHDKFDTITKAVIRYAATLNAAYTDDYQADYAKALFRMINKIDSVSQADIDYVKDRYEVEHPAIDVLKDFFGKKHFLHSMQVLASAFSNLGEYQKLSVPGADRAWKKSIEDYRKGTGRDPSWVGESLNEVETAEPIRGYVEPDREAPSIRAKRALKTAQEKFADAISQAGFDYSQNLNRKTINAKGISILRKTLGEFQLNYEKLGDLITNNKINIETSGTVVKDTPKAQLGNIKNGVDRLFSKTVVVEPDYITAPQAEALLTGIWNALHSDELDDKQLVKMLDKISTNLDGDDLDDYVRELKSKSTEAGREYKNFQHSLLRGGYSRQAIFNVGQPVKKKDLNQLLGYLKKFPEWGHAVGKGHNPNISGDDGYRENALSKMMMKMRLRWEHLDDIRESEPAKYIDAMREIADSMEKLIASNKTSDDMMDQKYKELDGLEAGNMRDGSTFFGMSDSTANSLENAIEQVRGTPDPFDKSPAERMKANIQDYLASSYERYYDKKGYYPDFYKPEVVAKLIKKRTSAIKNFLETFDKVSQTFGFSSQQSAIDNKKQLDKKEKNFKKKFAPTKIATIPGFDMMGNIFISPKFKRALEAGSETLSDRDIYNELDSRRNMYASRYYDVLSIPNRHYFAALSAKEVLDKEGNRGWRLEPAKQILRSFEKTYEVSIQGLKDYTDISSNNGEFKKILQQRKVEIDDSLGDGRKANKMVGVDLSELMTGPHGEPLDYSSAAAWHVNNPELSKKVKADEKKAKNAPEVQIPLAAGVEGMEREASNSIASKTNWGNLADYLKIERGVNDQGVNLLKKVYDGFDSNHEWRPEPDPDVCCMPRYIAAVKAATKYIKDGYNVSGGNYFRKNSDGSDGDDVSGLYGTPSSNTSLGEIDSVELRDTSYSEAKGDFEIFDEMMQNGIGNYIASADADRLVKFLTGGFSPTYKLAVLKAMKKNTAGGGEPVDIQQALALGKNNMESVFNKFDKLSLQEQIKLIAKVDANKIDEAWSKKYKDSIDCSNPKGFSQKAHCAGKKKKANENHGKYYCSTDKKWKYRKGPKQTRKVNERPLSKGEESDKEKYVKGMKKNAKDFKKRYGKDAKAVMYATATKMAKESVLESALPANDRVSVIKYLLSDSLLASDLQKQFYAYWAVPVPAMLDAFRDARALGGDKTDLRPILKGFVNSKVHPEEKRKLGLKESVKLNEDRDKERFEFIIDKLKQHPEFIKRVYRFIRTDVKNSERVHPQDFLQPERTAPEKDYAYKGVLPEFVRAIMNTDGDFDDIENFLASYGKQSYVNTKVLMKDGSATWDQWLQGGKGVSVEFISELYDNLFNVALNIEGSNRGPGEVGLALLAPNITFASVGDLKIDGVEVEVKGEKSSGGGRLKNSNADYGAPDLNSVYDKFKIAEEDRPQRLPSGNAGSRPGTHFLDIAAQLDTLAAGAGKEYVKELFTKTYIHGDDSMINYMVKNYAGMDRAEASALAGEISYSSYANILKEKGFSMFLFLKAPGKKSLAFDVDNYKNHLDKFKLGSLDWGDKMNGPAVQVSMR